MPQGAFLVAWIASAEAVQKERRHKARELPALYGWAGSRSRQVDPSSGKINQQKQNVICVVFYYHTKYGGEPFVWRLKWADLPVRCGKAGECPASESTAAPQNREIIGWTFFCGIRFRGTKPVWRGGATAFRQVLRGQLIWDHPMR